MSTCFLRRQSARYPATSRPRRGFTLVEMLIAMVLTLIMVYAIAEFYAYVGEAVKDGRAVIEMRGGLRTVTDTLKRDLDNVTVRVAPPVDDATATGYFSISEGVGNDLSPFTGVVDSNTDGVPDIGQDSDSDGIADYLEVESATNLLGDGDDILAFTTRATGDPFTAPAALLDIDSGIATGGAAMQTATVAEVVWFSSFTHNPTYASTPNWDLGEARNIHRRMLLIRPDVNLPHPGDSDYSGIYYLRVPAGGPTMGGPTQADVVRAYYELMQISDVSVRPFLVPMSNYIYFMANSLSDLTHRGNRFMNLMDVPGLGAPFPNLPALNPRFGGDTTIDPWHPNNDESLYRWLLNGARRGEDVIASNVLAFDVRVYDPSAVLRADAAGVVILQPGDPGYNYAIANNYTIQGSGAFVDLFYSRYLPAMVIPAGSAQTFAHAPTLKSQFGTVAVYDTWSTRYERDGLNQDGDTLTDEGTNGLDDDSRNGVDDVSDNLPAATGENETLPPYMADLRGVEVKVRIYEPGSRQAQQATVSADFVPE